MMLFLSTVLALAFASPASSFAIKLSLGVPPLQSQRLSHDIPIHPSVASEDGQVSHQKKLALTAALAAAIVFSTPLAALADGQTKEFKLPPIDFADKNRCVFQGSNMGQANAARDKLYDLRQCKLSGADASGLDLSGVLMSGTDVSKAKFAESYFSKGYLRDSNFEGADFTNAIIDRATFSGSSVKDAIFTNAVLTATSFENANVEGADFSDAYLGDFDIRSLCKNPTLKGVNPATGVDTRASVGCK